MTATNEQMKSLYEALPENGYDRSKQERRIKADGRYYVIPNTIFSALENIRAQPPAGRADTRTLGLVEMIDEQTKERVVRPNRRKSQRRVDNDPRRIGRFNLRIADRRAAAQDEQANSLYMCHAILNRSRQGMPNVSCDRPEGHYGPHIYKSEALWEDDQRSRAGQNTGHGHVYPRPDGIRARCGGPQICKQCALDLARKNAAGPATNERESEND